MELYSENKQYKLYHGNMLDLLEVIEPNTISSIVTDPPYELNFMGRGWDNSGIAFNSDTRKKCLEVLKPGGYLLAFGGSRTYHRIACAIEDAGFEIRDCIIWLYGSGFPKSLNIGLAIDKKNGVDNRTGRIVHHAQKGVAVAEKRGAIGGGSFGEARDVEERKATNERAGRGTALKPSYEPIIVARKPLEGSCTDNVIKYGVGGINIDECRVGTEGATKKDLTNTKKESSMVSFGGGQLYNGDVVNLDMGRFPANTILTYGDDDKEEVCSGFHNDEQRYYYTAKASKRDKDEGLQEFGTNQGKNIHPTVKPTDLMQYLVRLVTPNGGIVLDPFNGSGSTGKAVMYENKDRNKNYKYIGIELTDEYLPIAKARIEYVINKGVPKEELKQQSLF